MNDRADMVACGGLTEVGAAQSARSYRSGRASILRSQPKASPRCKDCADRVSRTKSGVQLMPQLNRGEHDG